uniref:NmrA-like domain-containing protein n=1 Tax=Batrachospermum sp. TaxID=31373 RepID=A0A8K1YUS0_9FLOR|nr:Hypothetical protein Ycf39 [Batrachospermum sp.]
MSLLVIGGTGTLGRQIVKKALDEGFCVKCLVRNFKKSSFLKEWGAELVYGDLKIPDTIPPTLYGISAIIDASTSRPFDEDYHYLTDLSGKLALILAAEAASIKRFIFFSIFNSQKHTEIPLMNFKLKIEDRLKQSDLSYTIFRIDGFFQGIITQYAIPILDKQSIWITEESANISYIDTQDVAKFTIRSLSIPALENKILPLLGPQPWNSLQIIKLCEKLSGQKAKISKISIKLLQLFRNITKLFEWTWNISERLAFTEILTRNNNFYESMEDVYKMLKINTGDMIILEEYLQEYFERVMKKLKLLNLQTNLSSQDINF